MCMSHKSLFWSIIYTAVKSEIVIFSLHSFIFIFIWRCYIQLISIKIHPMEMIYKQNLMIGWSEVFYDWNTCIYFFWMIRTPRSLNVGERLFNQTGVLRKNRYVQTSPPPNFFVDRISILNKTHLLWSKCVSVFNLIFAKMPPWWIDICFYGIIKKIWIWLICISKICEYIFLNIKYLLLRCIITQNSCVYA